MANLKPRYKKQLSEWIGGGRHFTLLYQATRDGCSAQTFHQMCNDKGATVTVLYNTENYVFGGYTSQPWSDSYGTYTSDNNAFLFRLAGAKAFQPKRYTIRQGCEGYATLQNNNHGPSFGNDLLCFEGTVNRTNNYFQGYGCSNFGGNYDIQEDNIHTFCGSNLKFTEIEVYQVTDRKPIGKKGSQWCIDEIPWRKISQSNYKTLVSHIEKYSPPEGSKVKSINILLLGPVGAGKSSFFNTVNSIFQREITTLARSGQADRSLTTTYRRYRVRSHNTGEQLNFRLCDTRGLESDGGLDLGDLIAVTDGHIPDRFQFNPTVPVSAQSTGYNSSPTPDDKIHCVAFVIDGTAVDVFPDKILQMLKSFQQRLNPKGIPQVIIVTKADKVCPEVQEDVGRIFHSDTIGELVEEAGQLFGLQRSCVFPVKNYEEEMEVNEKVDVPVLLCLKHVLRFAEDYIQDSLASD